MGKKDQRTKGNTKAASSARSAQLLGSNTGFVGFGTSAESAFVPILQGSDNDDGVPADFRLALRKMNKKDVTTKVKALQEFQELSENALKSVQSSSDEDLSSTSTELLTVLPFWASVYIKLATDTDRRVRELSHLCQSLIVRGVGKQLATHLRTMSGVWYLAMSDPHQPVAQAANSAWQSAFPTKQKQKSAVSYCQSEIMSSIMENITTATPQTLSDPKVTPIEEMESKYVRTLTMSLSGLARCISSVDISTVSTLFDHSKFWKLSKHKVGSVRRAFFELLVEVGTNQPTLLESRAGNIVSVTLGSGLLESDPGVAPAVWASALQVLNLIPGAWNLVSSPHKSVFPAVFKFIESGGAGIARSTFPNLLPFLSKISTDIMGDESKFLEKWFTSFKESVHTTIITKQRTVGELKAIVNAYVECLFYCCNKEKQESNTKAGFVTDHLLPLVYQSIDHDKMGQINLQKLMWGYLQSWDKQAQSKPGIASLNNLFWASLKHDIVTKLEKGDVNEVLALLQFCSYSGKMDTNIDELEQLMRTSWTILVEKLRTRQSFDDVCQCLALILPMSESVFTESSSKTAFLETCVVPLIETAEYDSPIYSLAWCLLLSMKTEEGAMIITKLCQTHQFGLNYLLAAAGPGAGSTLLLKQWMTNKMTMEWIISLANNLVAGDRKGLDTLVKVLSLGISLPDDYLHQIILVFKSGLVKCQEDRENKLVIYSDLFLLLLGQKSVDVWSEEQGIETLCTFFILDDGCVPGVQQKLESVWVTGVKLLGSESSLVKQINKNVKIQLGMVDYSKFPRLLEKYSALLSCLEDFQNIQWIFDLMPDWEKLPIPSPDILLDQVVTNNRFFLEYDLPIPYPNDSTDTASHTRIKVATFLTNLLLQYYCLNDFVTDNIATVTDTKRINVDKELMVHLSNVIFSVCYQERLNTRSGVKNDDDELGKPAGLLISYLDKESHTELLRMIRSNSLKIGGLWTDCLGWLVRLQYKSSEWDPRLTALLPRVDSWTVTELSTAVTVLSLSKEMETGGGMVSQTLSVECGRLISLGGLSNPDCVPLAWLIDHCVKLSTPAQLDLVTDELAAVMGTLPVWRADCEDKLLYGRDLGDVSWSEACGVAVVAQLLSTIVELSPSCLSPSVWDFACCSLVSWCTSLEESKESIITCPPVTMVAVAVSRLAKVMGQLLGPVGHYPALAPPLQSKLQDYNLPPSLREEWSEFFSEGVYTVLVPVFLHVCNAVDKCNIAPTLIMQLGSALTHCPPSILLSTSLPPLHLVQDVDRGISLPDHLVYFYNHLGPLLLLPSRHIQVTAAHMLASAAGATTEAEEANSDIGAGEEEQKEVPSRLVEAITAGNSVLETVLQEFRVGESVGDIPPGNIVHNQTRGYLLAWRVVLRLIETAGQELRPLYSEFLWSGGHLANLLSHLFRLLPVTSTDMSLFSASLLVTDPESSEELVCLAGSCWLSVCRHLPALARMWYQNQDKAAQTVVEKVTQAVVTPTLWREEVKAIKESEASSDNMELRVRDSVREVVATYTIDESSMELVVSLPVNHPLDQVSVESGKRVGVETGQWRKWMLQLTTFLTHQNGTILDGLNLWRKNVDKRFEGVEECYICYYILHGSNHQLPKLACRTCKKKFHSACLYKWFSTSNNSSCPLCRNLF